MSRARRLPGWFLALPAGVWLLLFFAVPILILGAYSVMPRGVYGGVESGFTLEHYRRFFDPLYLAILARGAIVVPAGTMPISSCRWNQRSRSTSYPSSKRPRHRAR